MSNHVTDETAIVAAMSQVKTRSFKDILAAGQMRPDRELRFRNWSNLSFSGQDLSGIDFTGARLLNSTFSNATIVGARFDQAVVATVSGRNPMPAMLPKALDWIDYCAGWAPSEMLVADGHFRDGDVFSDSPFLPEMVVFDDPAIALKEPRNSNIRPKRWPLSSPLAIALAPLSELQFAWFKGQTGTSARRELAAQLRIAWFRNWPDSGISSADMAEPALVTLQEAEAYIDWARDLTGVDYRLLSEAEWELAMQRQLLRFSSHDPWFEFCADNWRVTDGAFDDASPNFEADAGDVDGRVVRMMTVGGPFRSERHPANVSAGDRYWLRLARELKL